MTIEVTDRETRGSRSRGPREPRPAAVAVASRDDLHAVPAPHLDAPRSRAHRRAIATGLLVVDSAALALPMLWLGGVDGTAGALVAVALLVLAATGAYRPRITLSALDEAPRHLSRLGVALLLVAPPAHLTGDDLSLAVHAMCAVPCFVLGRGLGYTALRAARRRRIVEESALVVGGGQLGMDLLATMDEHPELGLRGIGFLTDVRPLDSREPLGRTTDLDLVLDTHDVRRIVVAYGPTREAELVGLLRSAATRDIEVFVVPRFFDVGTTPSGPDVEDLWGIPLHRLCRNPLRRSVWRVKRAIDVVISGTALTLLAPVLLVLAVAVRLSSPGPILFRQRRTGHDGVDISILKFRTLRVPAPAASPDRLGGTGSTRSTMHARQIDVEQRQTRIGTLLRRTSLDELPQLWNVLRGDMSLVGPRPEECSYAARFAESVHGYADRHRLAVGLTGWAQVNGLRGDTSIEERARFDNSYIERWTLWRDVAILVRTVAAVQRQAFNTAVRAATDR